MSHKLAKALRKTLRAKGIDPTQRSYVETNQRSRRVQLVGGGSFSYKTSTVLLAKGCGRFTYQRAKM